ncbi:hypothetical protein [Lactobacillus xujianguonis]|nr:hypothetical protein [Lactobacillus xujianguonis]
MKVVFWRDELLGGGLVSYKEEIDFLRQKTSNAGFCIACHHKE